jgi:mannose PTS system EIIA component
MLSVLVSTHGSAAKSLIETAEMICGEQSQCEAVSFAMGQSTDDFQQQLRQKLEALQHFGSEVLCFVDLKGGTPFNTLVRLMADFPNIEIVTGVNVPMLLETFMQRIEANLPTLLPNIIQAGTQGIEKYNMASMMVDEPDDEDF